MSYWIESDSLPHGLGGGGCQMRSIQRFLQEKVRQGTENTAQDSFDIKDPSPSKVLCNIPA